MNFLQKIKEPLTRDRIPTKEELRNILSYANLRDKAIYLTLLSSGIRVGELTQITIHDIYLDEKPVRIELEAEYCKNKQSRTVFISKEIGGEVSVCEESDSDPGGEENDDNGCS